MGKKKNICKKGFSCGLACIPKYKKCLADLGDESVNLINYFRGFIDKTGLLNTVPILDELEIEKKVNQLKSSISSEKGKIKRGVGSIDKLKNLEEDFKEYSAKFTDEVKGRIKDFYAKSVLEFINDPTIGGYETLEDYINNLSGDNSPYWSFPKESLLFLAELHSESRVSYNRRDTEIGDDLEEYNEVLYKNLEYVSRNLGTDNINGIIDSFFKVVRKDIDAKSRDERAEKERNFQQYKKEIGEKLNKYVLSTDQVRILSDNIRFNVLNNFSPKNEYSGQTNAKVAYTIRKAISSLGDDETDFINKIFSGDDPLSSDDIEKLTSLYSSSSSEADIENKDGSVLIRIGVLNKLAANPNVEESTILDILNSPFVGSLGTNTGDKKLYLGDVGGDANKLFQSDLPFGKDKNINNVLVNKALQGILQKNGLKLLKSEKELIPPYLNSDGKVFDTNYKGDNPGLTSKKRFVELLFQEYTRDKINDESPEILKALNENLPKDVGFNAFYLEPSGVENLLELISKGKLSENDGLDLYNKDLVERDAEDLLSKYKEALAKGDKELKSFFKEDFLNFMANFGFKRTEAAEYIPVVYASATGKQAAVLDKYDGKPFPFADAIIAGGDGSAHALVSVKYGNSGGVPADANALTNLVNPQYTKYIGRPGGKDGDEWDNLKRERSALEFGNKNPGIKLRDGVDFDNYLSGLNGHFNLGELKKDAEGGSDQFLKDFYGKVKLLETALKENDDQLLAVIFGLYNIDKMEKRFNAQNKITDSATAKKSAMSILESRVKENYPDSSPSEIVDLINKMSPEELLRKYGFEAKQSPKGLNIKKYYENYDLQLGFSHIVMAMWEQELFNNFFRETPSLKPTENHPDLDPAVTLSSPKLKEPGLIKKLEELGILNSDGTLIMSELITLLGKNPQDFYRLIFSHRTDAGSASRPSSGGTQYKYGGWDNILFYLLKIYGKEKN